MRRHSGQKALYEAMSRSHSKTKRPSMLARLRPQLEKLRPQLAKLRRLGARRPKKSVSGGEPMVEKPAPMVLKPPRPAEPQGPTQTWLRPKAVQINDGRIEVSLPYQIGIIIGLGVILVVMMGFWFGRLMGRIDERSRYDKQAVTSQADLGGVPVRSAAPDANASTAGAPTEPPPDEPAVSGTAVRTGDNVIVLARHRDREQLVPVQAYFREHGVETRTLAYSRLRSVFEQYGLDVSRLPKGDGFMLVTNGLYENQRIKELGRGYQAPSGYESFASNHFSDAYGMKIAK